MKIKILIIALFLAEICFITHGNINDSYKLTGYLRGIYNDNGRFGYTNDGKQYVTMMKTIKINDKKIIKEFGRYEENKFTIDTPEELTSLILNHLKSRNNIITIIDSNLKKITDSLKESCDTKELALIEYSVWKKKKAEAVIIKDYGLSVNIKIYDAILNKIISDCSLAREEADEYYKNSITAEINRLADYSYSTLHYEYFRDLPEETVKIYMDINKISDRTYKMTVFDGYKITESEGDIDGFADNGFKKVSVNQLRSWINMIPSVKIANSGSKSLSLIKNTIISFYLDPTHENYVKITSVLVLYMIGANKIQNSDKVDIFKSLYYRGEFIWSYSNIFFTFDREFEEKMIKDSVNTYNNLKFYEGKKLDVTDEFDKEILLPSNIPSGEFVLTNQMKDNRQPVNDLSDISLDDKKFCIFITWNNLIPLKIYDYVFNLYDSNSNIISVKTLRITPESDTWCTYQWFSIDDKTNKPGKWKLEVFADNVKVIDTYFSVY